MADVNYFVGQVRRTIEGVRVHEGKLYRNVLLWRINALDFHAREQRPLIRRLLERELDCPGVLLHNDQVFQRHGKIQNPVPVAAFASDLCRSDEVQTRAAPSLPVHLVGKRNLVNLAGRVGDDSKDRCA